MKLCAILANFCLNLVAMATPLAPLKILTSYLNLPTPKTLPLMQKLCRYLVVLCLFEYFANFTISGIGNFRDFFAKNSRYCLNILMNSQIGTRVLGSASYEPSVTFPKWTMRSRHEILCYLGLFLSKFGCHGNSLGSLDILDSTFESADAENLTIRARKSSISCPELKSVRFCLFLPKFGCHGNSLGPLEILDSMFDFADPEITTIDTKNCVDILYRNEVMHIWMFGISLPLQV